MTKHTKLIGRPLKYGTPTIRFSTVLPKKDLDYITANSPAQEWGDATIRSRGVGMHNVIAKARQMDEVMKIMECKDMEDVVSMIRFWVDNRD